MSENLNKLFSPVLVVETLTASKALDVYDTGKVFVLGADSLAITIPAPSTVGAGWFAKFIVGAALGGACTVTAPSAIIHGLIATPTDGAAVDFTDESPTAAVTFATAGKIGDYVNIVCDGTNYFVSGLTAVATGITFD